MEIVLDGSGSMDEDSKWTAAVQALDAIFDDWYAQADNNIGVGMKADKPDLGRYEVTKVEGDKGAFKTPTLREVSRHAPYMHDGSLATLEDVIDHYDKGGITNPQLDEEIFPLKLTSQEKGDLITFLKEGLSSPDYPDIAPPKLPK